MTDLLSSSRTRVDAVSRDDSPGRPLAVSAAMAGISASGAVLLACMAVGLVGWFASDAWLLAHGARLQLGVAVISVVPLGLTAFCLYVAFRLGRWAGLTSVVEDPRTAALGTSVLAGVYGAVATVTAVLASIEQAQPHLLLAFVGGFVVAFLGGGAGILAGSGRWPEWRSRIPQAVRAVAVGAVAVPLLMAFAGAVLVVVALLMDVGDAANVLARLHVDVPGGLLYTLVVAMVAPNAVLFGAAYLLGSGFAVGTGTLVSPGLVLLGPLPAFPLVAALPDTGRGPWWTTWLLAVPVLAGMLAAVLMSGRHPVHGYGAGALRGLAAGVSGGLLLTGLLLLAGGSVGPGRMADLGVPAGETVIAATAATGLGALVGAVTATWWRRRRTPAEDVPSTAAAAAE